MGFLFLYQIYFYLTVGAERQKFKKENGCKSFPRYPQIEPFLGLDLMVKVFEGSKKRTILEDSANRFREYGNTLSMTIGGVKSQ